MPATMAIQLKNIIKSLSIKGVIEGIKASREPSKIKGIMPDPITGTVGAHEKLERLRKLDRTGVRVLTQEDLERTNSENNTTHTTIATRAI